MKRVVVTGLGVVTPVGNSVDEMWKNCLEGNSGVENLLSTDEDYNITKTHIGASVKNFNPDDYIADKKSIRRMEKFSQYAVAASKQAVEQSGLNMEEHKDCVVSIGVGQGGLDKVGNAGKRFFDGKFKKVDPLVVPKIICNMASFWVSKEFDTNGPTYTPVAACASGGQGISMAAMAIMTGQSQVAIAGGAESVLCPFGLATFDRLTALNSEWNDRPTEASRPFNSDRAGFVMGEGAGVMVLEDYDHAVSRGATILAELVGFGTNADAYDMVAPMACGTGAGKCMELSLNMAGVNPEEVGFINMHGTSTPVGDIAETTAIKNVFGEHAYSLVANSTKSVMGHCIGAAGGIEAVVTVLTLMNQVATPTINVTNPDPDCDLNYSPNEPTKLDTRYGMSNSFGFGGVNTTLLFKV